MIGALSTAILDMSTCLPPALLHFFHLEKGIHWLHFDCHQEKYKFTGLLGTLLTAVWQIFSFWALKILKNLILSHAYFLIPCWKLCVSSLAISFLSLFSRVPTGIWNGFWFWNGLVLLERFKCIYEKLLDLSLHTSRIFLSQNGSTYSRNSQTDIFAPIVLLCH